MSPFLEQRERLVAVAVAISTAAAGHSALPDRSLGVVFVAIACALIACCSSTAPWWLLAAGATCAAGASNAALPLALASSAILGACWIGTHPACHRAWHAGVAGLIVNALVRTDYHSILDLRALTALLVCAALVAPRMQSLRARPTRVARIVTWATLGLVSVSAIGVTAAALSSRTALREGDQLADSALAAVRRGEFATAADLFKRSADRFDAARRSFGRPWVAPSLAIPVLAQHTSSASNLADATHDALRRAADAVAQIDSARLASAGGRIDLDALRELQQPLSDIDESIDALARIVDGSGSPWLLPPFADRLDALRNDLSENSAVLATARRALELAPAMLGEKEPRTYLVLFTTPAEARGLGGFPGNFAELHADEGRLSMPKFGRWSDLEAAIDPATLQVEGPPGFLDRYGQFGFELNTSGQLKGSPWRNITMPPDFPTVGQVAANLYPQSGGQRVDGVIVLDVYVLQSLLRFTGPIEVEGWPRPLNRYNAAQVLLRGQYNITQFDERIDFLSDAARTAFDALLDGALPGPVELARTLGPLAADRRLAVWATRDAEQSLLHDAHLDGAFPSLAGSDGFALAVTNLGGNKIDSFLSRSVMYESSRTDDSVSASMTVTFRNDAPPAGLPYYVIGNRVGLPDGTNRLRVCVYSALTLTTWTTSDDGAANPWERIPEFGATAYCRAISIAPESTTTLELQFTGASSTVMGVGERWIQPLVRQPESLP